MSSPGKASKHCSYSGCLRQTESHFRRSVPARSINKRVVIATEGWCLVILGQRPFPVSSPMHQYRAISAVSTMWKKTQVPLTLLMFQPWPTYSVWPDPYTLAASPDDLWSLWGKITSDWDNIARKKASYIKVSLPCAPWCTLRSDPLPLSRSWYGRGCLTTSEGSSGSCYVTRMCHLPRKSMLSTWKCHLLARRPSGETSHAHILSMTSSKRRTVWARKASSMSWRSVFHSLPISNCILSYFCQFRRPILKHIVVPSEIVALSISWL